MIKKFQSIINQLVQSNGTNSAPQFAATETDELTIFTNLNAAFLTALAGQESPQFAEAQTFLNSLAENTQWSEVANFYLNGITLIEEELRKTCQKDSKFANRLDNLFTWLSKQENLSPSNELGQQFWSVFFPEGTGILGQEGEKINDLRQKRTVTIKELNPSPVNDIGKQLLFSSNVLLTIPLTSTPVSELKYSTQLKTKLEQTIQEEQLYWYDHPIPIGIEPESNEILYGLRALNQAIEWEKERGNMSQEKIVCLLSVSVTHQGLQEIANAYLQEVLGEIEPLDNLEIYAFSEADTKQLITKVLTPALEKYLPTQQGQEFLSVFGVDGKYGRHYSFLKAILALWNVLINPAVKATFKIDLDQIFPQQELIEQTQASAFEHLCTPLWGAHGQDSQGKPIELGMIAGALVNERDINKGVFTPDVPFPQRALKPDEYIFFSTLPQALSTEAEMMTRYADGELDGKTTCIQRIHVTGGTNGILVSSLRRHRPFTPSFIGRAEDQAYIFSTFVNPAENLGYAHASGLIMRHDKEAFAQEAMKMAKVGKMIGDYIRILIFSNYAKVLSDDVSQLKGEIAPFTGCFVSQIPITVVYLRFALKVATLFAEGQQAQGREFITNGVPRIKETLEFISGENSQLEQIYQQERLGWNLYYDIISSIEQKIEEGDEFALNLQQEANKLVKQCAVNS